MPNNRLFLNEIACNCIAIKFFRNVYLILHCPNRAAEGGDLNVYRDLDTLFPANAYLGEGVWWDDNSRKLYWVDILQKEIHRTDPDNAEDRLLRTEDYVGCIAPCDDGTLIAGIGTELCFVDFDNGSIVPAASLAAAHPNIRFNDGKCDPHGRLWIGTMSNTLNTSAENPVAHGALYCFSSDLKRQVMLSDLYISNGIAFAPGGETMYHTDTMTQQIVEYELDPSDGTIRSSRPAVQIPVSDGSPDGMTIDEEGMLWVALWGGYCVARYCPVTGKELSRIKIPVKNVTCCAFGGDNHQYLFITTSSIGANEGEKEYAGRIFVAKTDVKGLPVNRFKKI